MLLTIFCLLSIFTSSLSKSASTCHGVAEYSQCSPNKECGCLHHIDTSDNSGICGLTTIHCSTMNRCSSNGKTCHDHNHICIRHPLCDFHPLCYPLNKATDEICPSWNRTSTTTSRPSSSTSAKPFHPSCDWSRDGNIVLNQLKGPTGLFLDANADDLSIYIADSGNHRVLLWTSEQAINSPVVVSINETDSLSYPRHMVIDKKDGSMLICDKANQRIVQWKKDSNSAHTLISNVECESLTIDNEGSLIVSEINKDRVTKWQQVNRTQSDVKAIAGAYGKGSNLNQLNQPRNVLLDEKDQWIYVSDSANHRIVKWMKGAKEGIVVAGGNGRGNRKDQLSFPRGIALHPSGDLYIADTNNHRIVRWKQGESTGTVIVDGMRHSSRQLPVKPFDIVFDRNYHNLYVTDWTNSRLLRFFIDGVGNCVTIT